MRMIIYICSHLRHEMGLLEIVEKGSSRPSQFLTALTQAVIGQSKACAKVLGRGSSGQVEDRRFAPQKRRLKLAQRTAVIPLVVKIITSSDGPLHPGFSMPLLLKVQSSHGKLVVTSCIDYTDDRIACPAGYGVVNEIVALLLTNRLYESLSPHFMYFDGWAFCEGSPTTMELFLERADRDLDGTLQGWSTQGILLKNEHVDSIILPVLHSLWLMHKHYNMSHYDCFVRNIFVIRTSKSIWKQDLGEITHFAYHVEDFTFYIPNVGFIIKMGDFGTATFEYGKTAFRNTYADATDKKFAKFTGNGKKPHPDWLQYLSDIVERFSGMQTVEKIKTLYPFNAVMGVSVSEMVRDDFIAYNAESTLLPSLKDVILTLASHLTEPPDKSQPTLLHIQDG